MAGRNKKPVNLVTILFGLLVLSQIIPAVWPLVRQLLRLISNIFTTLPKAVSVVILTVLGAWVLMQLARRFGFGYPLDIYQVRRIVYRTGRRYAIRNGMAPEDIPPGFEAPGYSVSEFIDRCGISFRMDIALIREYNRAFRK